MNIGSAQIIVHINHANFDYELVLCLCYQYTRVDISFRVVNHMFAHTLRGESIRRARCMCRTTYDSDS